MRQIVVIHWWNCFPDNDTFCKYLKWREYDPDEDYTNKRRFRMKKKLQWSYQVFTPIMPLYDNANYQVWKIRFEKVLPFLNEEELILIGHSLWWMFLLKYISENGFPKHIKQLYLVATCIDSADLPPEEAFLWDFTFDINNIPKVAEHVDEIFIYHSKDDDAVPYSQAPRIQSYLPKAKLVTFTDRKHFCQPEFPELLENILKGTA